MTGLRDSPGDGLVSLMRGELKAIKSAGLSAVLLFCAGFAHSQESGVPPFTIGEIEFFGSADANLSLIRSSLSVQEGETLSEKQMEGAIRALKDRPIPPSDRPPTDVDLVCCDATQRWMIYVGLGLDPATQPIFNPPPTGAAKLPRSAFTLYGRYVAALLDAVSKGSADEDDSLGYSLSNDPALRALQLQMRVFAVEHGRLLRRRLSESSSAQDRMAAAELLGYSLRSHAQIEALDHASRDPNAEVRNNATRALWVLSQASPAIAGEIPGQSFVSMLSSGSWSDRNKSSLLLVGVTASRPELLLHQIACEALPSLIEMAGWRSSGHAKASLVLLGRIAGTEEGQLLRMIDEGKKEEIISGAEARVAALGRPRSCPARVPSPLASMRPFR